MTHYVLCIGCLMGGADTDSLNVGDTIIITDNTDDSPICDICDGLPWNSDEE